MLARARSSGFGRFWVVLADDHASLRRNLRLLLERESDLVVVGEAHDLETAIRRLREDWPRAAVVVITMSANQVVADAALAAVAIGFVLTDSADLELCDVGRDAACGCSTEARGCRPSNGGQSPGARTRANPAGPTRVVLGKVTRHHRIYPYGRTCQQA